MRQATLEAPRAFWEGFREVLSGRRPLITPGLAAITRKELADQFHSIRFVILFALVGIAGLATIYVAAQSIRGAVAESGTPEFVFLHLFTASDGSLPPFTFFFGLLGPIVGLALGFDAVNAERNRGTLSRLASQPIHRDAIINGKFLARLILLALMIFSLGFVVAGLGLQLIGIPPSTEEAVRILIFLAVSVIYVAFWLSLSILFSVLFRQAATSALAGMAVWLSFVLFWGLLASLVANAFFPVTDATTLQQAIQNESIAQNLNRLSPSFLYDEITATLLTPSVRTLGPTLLLLQQIQQGAIMGTLPLGQSLLLIWPQLTGLLAATILCFGAAYVFFMRQEIRA